MVPLLISIVCTIPCVPFQEVLGPYANNPDNETRTVLELTAVRAGKSVLSFSYVGNTTNETVFKKYARTKSYSEC